MWDIETGVPCELHKSCSSPWVRSVLLDILLLHSYLVRQSVSYKHIIHGRVSALPQTCLLLRITLGLIPTSSSQYGSSFASSLSSFAIFAALLVLQQKYEGLTTKSLIGTASNNLCDDSSSLQHFPNHMQYCPSYLQHFLYDIRCCSKPSTTLPRPWTTLLELSATLSHRR